MLSKEVRGILIEKRRCENRLITISIRLGNIKADADTKELANQIPLRRLVSMLLRETGNQPTHVKDILAMLSSVGVKVSGPRPENNLAANLRQYDNIIHHPPSRFTSK